MKAGDARAAAPEAHGQPGHDATFEVQQLRAMEQPSWNEGRLDDLNRKVDDGIGRLDDERKELRAEMRAGFDKIDGRFERVDEEFKAVRKEMKEGFERVDRRFERVDEEFKAVRSELHAGFARMQWTLVGAAAVVIGALIGAPHL
jgi:hypothetical protein